MLADLRALPRPVWILAAGTFVNRFGQFVTTFLVLYLTAIGHSPAQAGLAVAAFGVGALVSGVGGGWIADRLGRRTSIALSMFTSAATVLALWRADWLPAIIGLTGLFGLTSELYRPAAAALIADFVPEGERVRAFALYRLAINAGVAIGPAVAGFLAVRTYSWLFVGDAVTSVLYGIVALIALPVGVRTRRSEEPPGAGWRAVVADRALRRFVIATTFAVIGYFQIFTTFGLHVRDAGYTEAAYGVLVGLNGLLIVFLELPITSITARFAARPVIALGMALGSVGLALLLGPTTLVVFAAAVVVVTFSEMIAAPVSSAYVADLAPAHLRGRYQGAFNLSFAMGLIVAPAVGAGLYDASPNALWGLSATLTMLAAAMVFTSPRTAPPPVA